MITRANNPVPLPLLITGLAGDDTILGDGGNMRTARTHDAGAVRRDRLPLTELAIVLKSSLVESGAGSAAMLSSHLFIVSTECEVRSTPPA